MTPYELGFISKCAEHGLSEDRATCILKMAGPSLRDRAAAGVPGASAKLRAQEEAKAYRKAHPSPLGSLSEQKAYIKQQGSKALDSSTPEQRSKFWDDARKFQADALRARVGLASLAGGGGLGLAGAAGLEGAGEALASKVEGRSTGSALGRGALAGGASYGLGKGVETFGRRVVMPAYRLASQKVPKASTKALQFVKELSPALRRKALDLNAHDPYHKKFLTRLLNRDIQRYGIPIPDDMYLTHATAARTAGNGFNSAMQFVSEGKAMPSMGLSPARGTGWYGAGYGNGANGVFVEDPGSAVRYFFDESMFKRPRTVVYNDSDAMTPTYNALKKRLGKLVHDPSARESAYSEFYEHAMRNSCASGQVLKPIKLQDALSENALEQSLGNAGKVFEVKPYSDVVPKDARVASISLDGLGTFSSAEAVARELGNKGIPYYFVANRPSYYRWFDTLPAGYRSGSFILNPVEMAENFAPKIR